RHGDSGREQRESGDVHRARLPRGRSAALHTGRQAREETDVSGATAPTVTLADVEAAARRLEGRIHRTPLLSFSSASRGGGRVFLKCENLQKVGAFKARGALNHLLQLPKEALARGVATYSSGNHGAALAWAAAQVGAAATIFVPEDIAAPKRAAIENYGGRVVVAGRTSNDRRVACEREQARAGVRVVAPFDDA